MDIHTVGQEVKMATLTPFGITLRKLRVEKGLRLFDVATELGLTTSFLSAIETGRKPIPDGFVVKIGRAMNLSVLELRELRSSADKTKKEIKVGDKSESDRELIAAFARRLDDVPEDIIKKIRGIVLKSIDCEAPFRRKRKGFVVPPLSALNLRGYAEQVRQKFVASEDIACPIIEIIEFGLPEIDKQFYFDVRDVREMGDNEGLVPAGGNSLILRQDVYDRACQGQARDRFTAAHEFAHYLIHRKVALARTTKESDKIFCDSEWQADMFAGYLLMSYRHLPIFASSADMAQQCAVSQQAASVMWDKYRRDGLVR